MTPKKEFGSLIVIEGIDGSGKATQQKLLAEYFKNHRIDFVSFDFPQYGKTFFGDFAGRFLNGEFGHFSRINPYLASFPYAADRWQARQSLWRAIKENKIVICNRYTPSSIYQAAKIKPAERSKFLSWVETLEFEVFNIPKPTVVVFLNLPLKYSQILLTKKNKRQYLKGKSKDQYEADKDYLLKVEQLYLHAAKNNRNWITIDCFKGDRILAPSEIHEKIIDSLGKSALIANPKA